jgi:hypothetical protein
MKPVRLSSFWLLLCFLAGVFTLAMSPRQQGVNITLVSFEADTSVDQIDLIWETATEFDIFGFYIQRSLQANGTYEDISQLIPGEGGVTGWIYYFSDTDVQVGTTYYYKLRVVNQDSTDEFYGPVWGTPGAPPTFTPSQSPTRTLTPTITRTPTNTATFTPLPTSSNNTPSTTPTPSATPTPTNTFTPTPTFTATPTGPTNTPRPPTSTHTVAAPVVSFTPEPSITPTPTETATEGPTPTEAPTATTTLLPLPSITMIWPTEIPSDTPSPTPRRYVTATRAFTFTPGPETGSPAVPLRVSFLGVIVAGLWLLLGVFLFVYLRRLGQ